MAVVLTLVETKQIIYINETTQNRSRDSTNTVNTSTHITKTPTHNKTNTYTHPHLTNQVKTTTAQHSTVGVWCAVSSTAQHSWCVVCCECNPDYWTLFFSDIRNSLRFVSSHSDVLIEHLTYDERASTFCSVKHCNDWQKMWSSVLQ